MIFRSLLIFLFLTSLNAWANTVLSTTVGQVGNYVITTRDVQISSVLDHWFLLAKKAEKAKDKNKAWKDWILDPKSGTFQKQVNTVMAEYLVMSEAENFSVAQMPATEIQRQAKELNEDLKDWSDWTRMEVSSAELERSLERHLRSKEFLKFKTESMGMQVSDADAKKYYDSDRTKFNNLPFENFKESIKEFLISRDVQAKMKDWFDVLKKKYKVKTLQFESEK